MVRFLGLLDIFSALLLLGVAFNVDIPQGLIIVISVYLIGKALIFIKDIGSWFDISGGILLILSFWFSIPIVILVIVSILIGSKGFLSLFA